MEESLSGNSLEHWLSSARAAAALANDEAGMLPWPNSQSRLIVAMIL